jgi:hypothetical protein
MAAGPRRLIAYGEDLVPASADKAISTGLKVRRKQGGARCRGLDKRGWNIGYRRGASYQRLLKRATRRVLTWHKHCQKERRENHATGVRSHCFNSQFHPSNLSIYAPVLYTEDLQDGIIIDNTLKIINPFSPEKPL